MHLDWTQTTLIGDTLELMQGIEDVLLRLQQSHADTDIASTIPDTAQAIQNMTNIYGCKHVIAFLSVFESVLNRMRDAELRPKADLIALLLTCCDHVSRMASHLARRDEIYLGDLKMSHGLIRQLRAYLGNRIEHATAT
jgi:two-component system chemotaxis sensor kinase CheA